MSGVVRLERWLICQYSMPPHTSVSAGPRNRVISAFSPLLRVFRFHKIYSSLSHTQSHSDFIAGANILRNAHCFVIECPPPRGRAAGALLCKDLCSYFFFVLRALLVIWACLGRFAIRCNCKKPPHRCRYPSFLPVFMKGFGRFYFERLE